MKGVIENIIYSIVQININYQLINIVEYSYSTQR